MELTLIGWERAFGNLDPRNDRQAKVQDKIDEGTSEFYQETFYGESVPAVDYDTVISINLTESEQALVEQALVRWENCTDGDHAAGFCTQ